MTANEQTAGISPHYATPYQHWDFVLDTGMGYLTGCATKYVSRWRKKNGVADLTKALHYTNKSIEVCAGGDNIDFIHDPELGSYVDKFAKANELGDQETDICFYLARLKDMSDLHKARDLICALMDQAEGILPAAEPVPLEDSNKHAACDGIPPQYREGGIMSEGEALQRHSELSTISRAHGALATRDNYGDD